MMTEDCMHDPQFCLMQFFFFPHNIVFPLRAAQNRLALFFSSLLDSTQRLKEKVVCMLSRSVTAQLHCPTVLIGGYHVSVTLAIVTLSPRDGNFDPCVSCLPPTQSDLLIVASLNNPAIARVAI